MVVGTVKLECILERVLETGTVAATFNCKVFFMLQIGPFLDFRWEATSSDLGSVRFLQITMIQIQICVLYSLYSFCE